MLHLPTRMNVEDYRHCFLMLYPNVHAVSVTLKSA